MRLEGKRLVWSGLLTAMPKPSLTVVGDIGQGTGLAPSTDVG